MEKVMILLKSAARVSFFPMSSIASLVTMIWYLI